MIHQYEEHGHGRFVYFFNSTVGEGCPVLTKSSDLLMNVLGVWLVFFVSFYPTKYVVLPRDARSCNIVPEKARKAPSRKRQYSSRELTGDDPRNRSSRLSELYLLLVWLAASSLYTREAFSYSISSTVSGFRPRSKRARALFLSPGTPGQSVPNIIFRANRSKSYFW